MTADTTRRGGTAVIEALAFLCEIAMLVVLVVAGLGWNGPTGVRIAAAIMLPLMVVLGWAYWLAPTSKTRLADPGRLIVQYLFFILTGLAAVVGGHRVLGIVFTVVALIVFGLARLGNGVTGGSRD
jgi:Protein of unknown function (DUF2568)